MASETALLREEIHLFRQELRELRADLKPVAELQSTVRHHGETLDRHEKSLQDLHAKAQLNAVDNAGTKPKINAAERVFWLVVAACITGFFAVFGRGDR